MMSGLCSVHGKNRSLERFQRTGFSWVFSRGSTGIWDVLTKTWHLDHLGWHQTVAYPEMAVSHGEHDGSWICRRKHWLTMAMAAGCARKKSSAKCLALRKCVGTWKPGEPWEPLGSDDIWWLLNVNRHIYHYMMENPKRHICHVLPPFSVTT